MNMARNLHGMHAPIKMAMEQSLVTKARGVSMLPQSNLGLDILLGKDESIDFEDFLNGMRKGRRYMLAIDSCRRFDLWDVNMSKRY